MELDVLVEEEGERMAKRLIEDSRFGRIWGKQVSLEQLRESRLALVDHPHIGKEPTTVWQYDVVRLAAEAAGLEVAKFSLVTCSDEANRGTRFGTHLYGGAFAVVTPGGAIDFQDLEIGAHEGHTRHVILNIQHVGQYKDPNSGDVYFGKVMGDSDGVLRDCCGKLSGLLKMMVNGQSLPEPFTKLEQYASEFQGYDLKDNAQFSEAMWKLVIRHMGDTTQTILAGLSAMSNHGHSRKFVVAEGLSLNRHYKYDSPLILAGMRVVDNGRITDLSKTAYDVADTKAAERLSKIID